jgi:hypothetical protein
MMRSASGKERAALLGGLSNQRRHVLGVMKGHVMTETAVHAGHLDAARELIDGRTWLGPPGSRVPRD